MIKQKRKKQKLFQSAGFSVVEILIVTGIIAVITGMIIYNEKVGRKRTALRQAAQKIAQDLRLAQNKALTGNQFQGKVPYGFGVYFDTSNPTEYIIFADCDDGTGNNRGNKKYDSTNDDCPNGTGSSELISTEKVPEGARIMSITDENNNPNKNYLNIVFAPPEPTTTIYDESADIGASVLITLNLISRPTETKGVIVRTTGQISITPTTLLAVCGNGVIEGAEQCEPPNQGDCSPTCTFSSIATLTAPTSFAAAAEESTSARITLTWTDQSALFGFQGTLILQKTSVITTDPEIGTVYQEGDSVGSATVVYSGAGETKILTGLNEDTKYFYKAYTFNTSYNYSSAALIEGSATENDSFALYGNFTDTSTADFDTSGNSQSNVSTAGNQLAVGGGGESSTIGYAWSKLLGWIKFDSVTVWPSELRGVAQSGSDSTWEDFLSLNCLSDPNHNPPTTDVCAATQSDGVDKYKVKNDGNGNLSGWAWSEDIGWVSFYCNSATGFLNEGVSCGNANYQVTIDGSGDFSGWAWSEIGEWISFNVKNCDTDGDGFYEGGGEATGTPATDCPTSGPAPAYKVTSGNISNTYPEYFAWSDPDQWLDFRGTSVTNTELRGVVQQNIGNTLTDFMSLNCLDDPSGNVCGSYPNYKVRNDGSGNLTGWAWSGSIGWVSFYCKDEDPIPGDEIFDWRNEGVTCSNSTDASIEGQVMHQVTVNPTTGIFSGWAWSDVSGWISLNCNNTGINDQCNKPPYFVTYWVDTSWGSSGATGWYISAPYQRTSGSNDWGKIYFSKTGDVEVRVKTYPNGTDPASTSDFTSCPDITTSGYNLDNYSSSCLNDNDEWIRYYIILNESAASLQDIKIEYGKNLLD